MMDFERDVMDSMVLGGRKRLLRCHNDRIGYISITLKILNLT